MKLKESTSKNIDIDKIESLRQSVGWHRRRSNTKWKEVLSKSYFVYSVWDKNKLVGMGRILEDGIMCMFYDIVVHKDYQNKKIGKKIMTAMIKKVKDKKYTSIGLFAWDKNSKFLFPFYAKFGFEKTKYGMELKKHMGSI
jgi:GNAT superfamily N-acetyltransferase